MIVLLLLMIIWLCYVSAVCINGGERTTFHKIFRKLILLIQKLWIISINSVRNLHILNFSRKKKQQYQKSTKMPSKSGPGTPIYTYYS